MDAAEWNLELERVLPQLKVTVRSDNKVKAAKGDAFVNLLSVCLTARCGAVMHIPVMSHIFISLNVFYECPLFGESLS